VNESLGEQQTHTDFIFENQSAWTVWETYYTRIGKNVLVL